MNKYSIYVGGTFDESAGGYRGGTLDATFTNEREAFFHQKKLEWEFKKGLHMECEGDERFMIVPVKYPDGIWYNIVDKRTQGFCYGVCRTMQEAIEAKAWDERYHYEGGKWMDDYYKQWA